MNLNHTIIIFFIYISIRKFLKLSSLCLVQTSSIRLLTFILLKRIKILTQVRFLKSLNSLICLLRWTIIENIHQISFIRTYIRFLLNQKFFTFCSFFSIFPAISFFRNLLAWWFGIRLIFFVKIFIFLSF